eukprot:TRINITY_DN15031_c0_g1_i3.p1 TRINITY_DN15031_c0_g1~~TRINITY_DN15031_c0_g1_i3.p1  ORF type:complete len:1831 (+),score=335.53 TRINITY_DN15031_c0_g1_i3:61-5553(+)
MAEGKMLPSKVTQWSELPTLARITSQKAPEKPEKQQNGDQAAKELIRQLIVEASLQDDKGRVNIYQVGDVLKAIDPSFSIDEWTGLAKGAVQVEDGKVPLSAFLDWLFPGLAKVPDLWSKVPIRGSGTLLDRIYSGDINMQDAWVQASFGSQLAELLQAHPYLEPGTTTETHTLHYWVRRCRESFMNKKFGQAQDAIRRLIAGLDSERRQINEAFRRFDFDGSGHLDKDECMQMCAYLGWALEEADLMDVDKDGRITLPDFQLFVGRLGGVLQLFEHRRLRISASRKDVCDHAGLSVGARVRAHFYCHGQKSRTWREAQVLEVGVEKRSHGIAGPVTYGVLLEFGFGYSDKNRKWRARQVVPPTWVLSSVEDAEVSSALRQIGLLDEDQAFWALLLPDSEMRAVERLVECQRAALAGVRAHSTASHEECLPAVRERFKQLGFTGRELEATLGWIQDLAPVCVHVGLDRMGHFLETDEFYRNQFETKTSCGALDPQNNTRRGWEKELFGGAYDTAKGFDRCKYGALNVMNDYRGVVTANQYGDSYMVLKDVRLRCTFASTDSGGIQGKRLGVLDKYAHVLKEYNDKELQGLVEVAMAATSASSVPTVSPKFLRGGTEDATKDWVTLGFPSVAQQSGRFYFEVHLQKGCSGVQVGLLSSQFESSPGAKSTLGVGDDPHGWAVDGLNASRWHAGRNRAWTHAWPSEEQNQVRSLKEPVTVGVAVDMDACTIQFSSNGMWDERPGFSGDDIPFGAELYPAMSLQGKAAFCFGPDFKFSPPESGSWANWPGGLVGTIRVDNPRIGDEKILALYKEVQIHGEVHLKTHVQRLVAAQKYREVLKTKRSYSLRVKDAGRLTGTYDRAGAHNDLPLYRSNSKAIIYADPEAGMWRMSQDGHFQEWQFSSPMLKGIEEPPRKNWMALDEARGIIDRETFRCALKNLKLRPTCGQDHQLAENKQENHTCDMCGESGTAYRCTKGCDYDLCKSCYEQLLESCRSSEASLTEDTVDKLVETLTAKHPDGRDLVYRVRGENSLTAEWGKLGMPATPELVWDTAVEEAKKKLKDEAGFALGTVVETSHPYDANRFQWRREVYMDGVDGLFVHFFSKTCTMDKRARFQVYTGGLRREKAGVGARVELTVNGSSGDKVWATVVERTGVSWKLRLDTQHELACWMPAPTQEPGSEAWPVVGDEVQAKSGNWYRATVAEIRDDGTCVVDWFDKETKDREKRRDELRQPAAGSSEGRFLEDLPRYCRVPVSSSGSCFAVCVEESKSITVRYTKGAVTDEQGYGTMVGDEIKSFALDRSCPLMPISIGEFGGHGPAQESGVKVGWYLDLAASFSGASKDKFAEIFKGIGGLEDLSTTSTFIDVAFHNLDEVQERLNNALRATAEVTLIFTQSCSPKPPVLLPEARAMYTRGSRPCDEISEALIDEKGVVSLRSFLDKGPAQLAGTRTDWLLDLQSTLNANPALAQGIPEDLACLTRYLEEANKPPPGSDEGTTKKSKKKSKKQRKRERRAAAKAAAEAEEKKESDAKTGEEKEVDSPEEGIAHEFFFTFEQKDGMLERLESLVKEAIKELPVDDPKDIAEHYPGWDPSPKVFDVTGKEIASPADLEGCSSDLYPIKFTCFLPKPEPEVDEADATEKAPEEVEQQQQQPQKPSPSKEEAQASLMKLFAQTDVTLVFKHPQPNSTMSKEAFGVAGSQCWQSFQLAGDYAEFQFSTDGDGGDDPEKRWGVLALVLPIKCQTAPSQEDADKFCAAWVETLRSAAGTGGTPQVESDGWNESRLRALCAQHGWEFEWMTEDGERRRRVNERWDLLKMKATAVSVDDAARPDGFFALP